MMCTPRELLVFDYVNEQRHGHGLAALEWNEAVYCVARQHSASMAARRFISHHDSHTGEVGERLHAAGIAWRACGENLHANEGYSEPERTAVDGWMKSSGHRRNILSTLWTQTGVGVVERGDGLLVFTQVFLKP